MAGRHNFKVNDAPYLDDNSYVFKSKAEQALNELFVKIGREGYRAWWTKTFEIDGKNADHFSWREIFLAAEQALNEQ